MSISSATLELLLRAGLSGDRLLEVVRSVEADAVAPSNSSGADRQRRYRERKASQRDVTRDVTGDASLGDASPLPLPLSPQTPQTPTPTPGVYTSREREPASALMATLVSGKVLKDRQDQAFIRFWSAYPRKVGKPTAERAFVKAWGRAGPDPPSTIQAGLEAHLTSWAETDPELVPHPTTWLNRDGWNDQPTQPRRPRLVHDRADDRHASKDANYARAFAGARLADRGREELLGEG